jgi:acetylornithine deacetylase/succinyl-diaminopimelate desuccinylase-like protein
MALKMTWLSLCCSSHFDRLQTARSRSAHRRRRTPTVRTAGVAGHASSTRASDAADAAAAGGAAAAAAAATAAAGTHGAGAVAARVRSDTRHQRDIRWVTQSSGMAAGLT